MAEEEVKLVTGLRSPFDLFIIIIIIEIRIQNQCHKSDRHENKKNCFFLFSNILKHLHLSRVFKVQVGRLVLRDTMEQCSDDYHHFPSFSQSRR